jgi:hypothetical protein
VGDDPSDLELFREMWPEICSEETTYDAAFAALPYLIDLAARLGTAEADEYLIVAGLIATYASDVPNDLEPAFGAAMQRGLTLALERLEGCKTDAHLRPELPRCVRICDAGPSLDTDRGGECAVRSDVVWTTRGRGNDRCRLPVGPVS